MQTLCGKRWQENSPVRAAYHSTGCKPCVGSGGRKWYRHPVAVRRGARSATRGGYSRLCRLFRCLLCRFVLSVGFVVLFCCSLCCSFCCSFCFVVRFVLFTPRCPLGISPSGFGVTMVLPFVTLLHRVNTLCCVMPPFQGFS